MPHILVVENYEDVRSAIVECCHLPGSRLRRQMAVPHCGRFWPKGLAVDAIVLDCKMPGEPSAQLALHAKQLRRPVVMISGSPEAMKFAQENEFQLLHKPFRIADLLSAIEAARTSGEFGQRGA